MTFLNDAVSSSASVYVQYLQMHRIFVIKTPQNIGVARIFILHGCTTRHALITAGNEKGTRTAGVNICHFPSFSTDA